VVLEVAVVLLPERGGRGEGGKRDDDDDNDAITPSDER